MDETDVDDVVVDLVKLARDVSLYKSVVCFYTFSTYLNPEAYICLTSILLHLSKAYNRFFKHCPSITFLLKKYRFIVYITNFALT